MARKRKRRGPTVDGVPSGPICLLCGVQIPDMPFERDFSITSFLLDDGQWKDHMRFRLSTKNFMVPSEEVEAIHFSKIPTLCSSFCRAVVKPPLASEYHLTGINFLEFSREPLWMPEDVNIALIGGGGRKPRYNGISGTQFHVTEIYDEPTSSDSNTTGYVVHAHCWALLERILGPEVKQTQLDKLIQAAKKHWSDNVLWNLYDDDVMWGSICNPRPPNREQQLNIHLSPLVIPEIQNAIQRAKKIKSHSISCLINLPLEISLLIMELVCPIYYSQWNVQDTRNILSAFQWVLPNSFWELRLRTHERLLFELRSLKDMSSIGWQSLCLDMMALLCDNDLYKSSGLATRERVLRLVDDILTMGE